MSARLAAAALVAAVAALTPAAHAEEVCVRGVCANAPYCGVVCDADRLLDFQCTDDVQVVCDVRDVVRG